MTATKKESDRIKVFQLFIAIERHIILFRRNDEILYINDALALLENFGESEAF